jgi:hypothetical protein
VTTNGSGIWATGAGGGVRYATKGAWTSTQISAGTVTNFRQVNIFSGQLFASDSSGTTNRLSTIGTGTPNSSGQAVTNLPPNFETSTGSPYGFFFARLESGAGPDDTVYVADDAANQIQKWSFMAGTWVQTGGITASGVRGLTGSVDGSTVTLYATTGGSSGTGGGTIYKAVDPTGFDVSAAGTATSLATAPGNSAFRGKVGPSRFVISVTSFRSGCRNASCTTVSHRVATSAQQDKAVCVFPGEPFTRRSYCRNGLGT